MLFTVLPIYIILTVIVPLKLKWPWKVALGLLALASAGKMKINAWFGTDWFTSPASLPRPILMFFLGAYAVAVLFLCLTVLSDMVQSIPFLYCLWKRRDTLPAWRRFRTRVHLGFLIVSMFLACLGLYNGLHTPDVVEIELEIPNLHPNAEGVTIAQITDTHADPYFPEGHMQRIVDKVNALKPDFIALTGDLMDGEPFRRLELVKPLEQLKANHGKVAVTGNHEYFSDYAAWQPHFASWGIQFLDNAHASFPEQGIAFVGLPDRAGKRFNYESPDAVKATEGLDSSLVRIGLVHRPGDISAWNVLPHEQRPALQLSGHTHGGMVPLMKTAIARFNDGYVEGFYDVDGIKLYVSRGTSVWNGFPIRICCPSEITLFRLKKAK